MISSKKINLVALLLTALVLAFTVCAIMIPSKILTGNVTGSVEYSENHSVLWSDDDYYSNYSETSVEKISLNGTSATSNSKNVSIDGNEITILGGGTYVMEGELNDGNIIIDSPDGAEVRLVLNGITVTSSDFSALYVKQAAKVVISLVEGTENYLTNGSSYTEEKLEDGKPTAAVYSKDDLTINGSGTLVVSGNYQDGIKANDVFKVTEGTLKITAVDDAINVNDYIAILDSSVEINSTGDAIKCENESTEKGFIVLEGTTLAITSEGDGVYASSSVYSNEVTAQITTGGGSEASQNNQREQGHPDGGFGFDNKQSNDDTVSAKGIKAGNEIVINGGNYTLNNSDDSIHSDTDMTITGGVFAISTGDDAVHAEKNLVLAPETLDITKCYEGLEGAYITINNGNISIVSNDDGINAAGENSYGGGMGGPMMGMHSSEALTSEEDIYLTVNGGHIYIETSGDGFDSNGSAAINGGFLEVYGPENAGNGSIDIGDGGYVLLMNGGRLLAAGSSGMAETPAESSTQNSLAFYLDETYSSGSSISVKDSDGNEIISGTSNKKFDFVCVSTDSLMQGKTYTLVVNDNEITNVELTDIVTTSGNKSRGAVGTGRR